MWGTETAVGSSRGVLGRRGVTLVEVTLATVVLTVGILALVATAGGVARTIGQGGRLGRSAVAAEGRLELLRAGPCASLIGGTSTEGELTLTWTVATEGASTPLRAVQLTVSYRNGRDTRFDVYATAIACAG